MVTFSFLLVSLKKKYILGSVRWLKGLSASLHAGTRFNPTASTVLGIAPEHCQVKTPPVPPPPPRKSTNHRWEKSHNTKGYEGKMKSLPATAYPCPQEKQCCVITRSLHKSSLASLTSLLLIYSLSFFQGDLLTSSCLLYCVSVYWVSWYTFPSPVNHIWVTF